MPVDGNAREDVLVVIREIELVAHDIDAVDAVDFIAKIGVAGLHQRVIEHLVNLACLDFETVHDARA